MYRLPVGYGLFVLLLFVVGCSLGCPGPPVEPTKTWNVSARTLYLEYRDGDLRRTGSKIRVFLDPAGYEVDGATVRWFEARTTGSPDIIFEVRAPLAANDRGVYIEGTCGGLHATSTGRAYILVRDCSVTPR